MTRTKIWLFSFYVALLGSSTSVRALELNWSGKFSSEAHFIHNYSLDASDQGSVSDPARAGQGGYYIPGGGKRDAIFQTLFLRLQPSAVVNDNVYIKSEFWLGDPIFGIFGNALPYSSDQRQFYSTQSRGSVITAQRFWGEFVTDLGTFMVGRQPLHWGLGVVWNSGDRIWDRYLSTGDAIRWNAKFGSFTFIPSLIVESTGNSVGGACVSSAAGCTAAPGGGAVTDYSLVLKYENVEDEMEFGANFIKRLAAGGQDPLGGVLTPTGTTSPAAGEMNFLTYDIFFQKKLSQLSLAGEVPVTSGSLNGVSYQSIAVATEFGWKLNDVWDFALKAGYAPGQPSVSGTNVDSYRAFFFHPNYKLGTILFNYQLANLSRAQTLNNPNTSPANLGSPYDSPIVNAQYLALSTQIHPWEKWTLRPGLIYAKASQTAASGSNFYNYWTRTVSTNNSGKTQGTSLGWELDLGVSFQWDDNFQFGIDTGVFFPGSFYAFSNTAQDNATDAVLAAIFKVGVTF